MVRRGKRSHQHTQRLNGSHFVGLASMNEELPQEAFIQAAGGKRIVTCNKSLWQVILVLCIQFSRVILVLCIQFSLVVVLCIQFSKVILVLCIQFSLVVVLCIQFSIQFSNCIHKRIVTCGKHLWQVH